MRQERGVDKTHVNPREKKDNDVDHDTEVIATVDGGINNKS